MTVYRSASTRVPFNSGSNRPVIIKLINRKNGTQSNPNNRLARVKSADLRFAEIICTLQSQKRIKVKSLVFNGNLQNVI